MNDMHNPYTPPKAGVSGADSDPNAELPASRPAAVNIALFLLGVDILLAAIGVADVLTTVEQSAMTAAALIGGIDIAVTALLCVFVAGGRNWARIVILALWILSLVSLLTGFYLASLDRLPAGARFDTSWSNILWMVTPNLLTLAIVILLFGPGRNWFRKRERIGRRSRLRMFALLFAIAFIVLAIAALVTSYRA